MLLGWAPKDNRELFTLKEFVTNFQKGELQISNPVFNRKKLDWFNGVYIRKKSDQELFNSLSARGGSAFGGKPFAPRGMSDNLIKQTVPLVKDRLRKLSEYSDLVGFLVEEPKIDEKLLIPKEKTKKETRETLLAIINQLSVINQLQWRHEKLEEMMRKFLVDKLPNWQAGELFMVVRIAITGKTCTPPLFESMVALGKSKTLDRIERAAKALS